MPGDLWVTDDPAALSDLARRWKVPKRRLRYAADSRRILPTLVAGNLALYDALAQEAIAGALAQTQGTGRGKRGGLRAACA